MTVSTCVLDMEHVLMESAGVIQATMVMTVCTVVVNSIQTVTLLFANMERVSEPPMAVNASVVLHILDHIVQVTTYLILVYLIHVVKMVAALAPKWVQLHAANVMRALMDPTVKTNLILVLHLAGHVYMGLV